RLRLVVVEQLADLEGASGLGLGLVEGRAERVDGLEPELCLGEAELLLRGADRVVDRDERRAGALVQLLGGQPQRVVRRQLLTLRSARSGGPLLAAPGPGDQRDDGDADEADDEEGAEGAHAPAVTAGRSAADGAAG